MLAASAATVSCLIAAAIPQTAYADEFPKPRPTDVSDIASAAEIAQMEAEKPLIAAIEKIESSVASDDSGFAGTEIDKLSVVLWWKGAVPAHVQTAVEQAGRNVPVTVKPAKFSRRQLEAKAETISAAMERDPASSVRMVKIPVNGSRVVAGVAKGSKTAVLQNGRKRIATSQKATAQSLSVNEEGEVPVDVVEMEPVKLAAGPSHRYNDGWNGSSPSSFAGGGAMYAADGSNGRCTAGFGVTNGTEEFILTAAHCGYPNQPWDNGNHSRRIGNVSHEWTSRDVMLIRTNANKYMWDGHQTIAAQQWTKTVVGWGKVAAGGHVCTSGSTTGGHCGWTNSSDLTYRYCDTDEYGTYECYDDLIFAEKNNINGVRGGDSGGAVFTFSDQNVTARGIISGGASDSNSSVLVYQDFYSINQHWGIRPIT